MHENAIIYVSWLWVDCELTVSWPWVDCELTVAPEFAEIQLTFSHTLGTSTLKLITLGTGNQSGALSPAFTKHKLSKHGLRVGRSHPSYLEGLLGCTPKDTFCPTCPSCLRWQVYKHCLHPLQKKTLASTAAHVAQQLRLQKNTSCLFFEEGHVYLIPVFSK